MLTINKLYFGSTEKASIFGTNGSGNGTGVFVVDEMGQRLILRQTGRKTSVAKLDTYPALICSSFRTSNSRILTGKVNSSKGYVHLTVLRKTRFLLLMV